jgi:hypothetical protein
MVTHGRLASNNDPPESVASTTKDCLTFSQMLIRYCQMAALTFSTNGIINLKSAAKLALSCYFERIASYLGCQIFLDTIYQNWGKYTELPLNYLMVIN